MGIADLWPILPSDERVPFPVFIARFLQKHARPPRFAIDAYMFMFWSSVSNGDTEDPLKESYDIRNFMAKLWYLVQNNVSFVVVFDGKYKPGKLRNGHIPELPEACSYDDILKYFLRSHTSDYSEGSGLVEKLKKILSRNRMDWVQAPAEAEAECAWLQKLGVVDYVISDDSDALVFGATGVLRWFNRVKYYTDEKEPVQSSTDYYVTPVHMSHVTAQTSLTRNHLVMIAVLRGGDYSTGADGIGITRAKELALCGTTMLLKSARKTQQDFGSFPALAEIFVNTFLDSAVSNEISPYAYFGIKPELDRAENLAAFNVFLNDFLIENGKKVFGRATTFKNKVRIEDYYAMLYFFPLVNRRIFKFLPHSTTFGEVNPVTADLPSINVDSEVSRFNLVVSPRVIGKSVLKQGSQSFHAYMDLKIDKIPLPRERKYNLKAFALKFLRDKAFWSYIHFARIRELEGVLMVVLKFNRVKLNEYVYHARKDVDLDPEPEVQFQEETIENKGADEVIPELPEDEDKMISVVVPLECVSFVSKDYVKAYKHLASRRSPQKKKASPQKTTLDSFWPNMSPIKKDDSTGDQREMSPTPVRRKSMRPEAPILIDEKGDSTQDKDVIDDQVLPKHSMTFQKEPSPTAKAPAKKQFRRRRDKKELLPGQSTLTTFLQSKRVGGSEKDVLFVPSDDEATAKDEFYQNMKDSFGFGPVLSASSTKEVYTQSSSPEVSPTKRHRKRMEFSPDNSPIKAKSDTKDPW